MNEENIYLRFAEEEDCKDLFNWRNDPLSIKQSLMGKVNYNTHKKWFNEKIKDTKTHIFIITTKLSEKIGVVRFDKKIDNALVSINLNPDFRGKGLGSISLIKAIKQYFNNFDVNLAANIKECNKVSLKIFEKAGFREVSKERGLLTFKLTKNEFNKIWN